MKPAIVVGNGALESEVRRSIRGELSGLAVLFGLTLRQQIRGRRLLVLVVLFALPCILAIVLRSLQRPAPTDILEFALIYNLVPHALAPLTALLYAGGMIQDEVEEQTLTYLLVRPLPSPSLYVCKLLATLLLTTMLVAAATTGLYLAIYWNATQIWAGAWRYGCFKRLRSWLWVRWAIVRCSAASAYLPGEP